MLVALIVSGCGGAANSIIPSLSSSDGRKELEEQISAESGGLIKLAAYNKVSSADREIGGRKMTEVEYTGEIEFTDDCLWNPLGFMARPDTRPDKSKSPDLDWRVMKKGERSPVKGRIMVAKPEK
jgi:hypothetical protein